MMKKYLLNIAIGTAVLFSAQHATAQGVAVNTTGTAADTSAMLDVNSSSKGLLVPRMTSAQINSIHIPATGLMVFQTDGTPGFYYNSGTPASPVWTAVRSTNPGSIIPFASGTAMTLTTGASGLPNTGTLVGFGNCVTGVFVGSSTIDASTINNMAFSVPRSGTITSVSAYFSLLGSQNLIGTTIFVIADLWESTAPNNVFTQVSGTNVNLTPILTGTEISGTTSNGIITGLSIPVTSQTRLLLVYSILSSGGSPINTITGYGSAGVNIQ